MLTVETFVVGYLQNDCYLAYTENENKAFAVDPSRGSYALISARAKELGKTVVAVLITHGHFDHIMDAALWENDGAQLYVHAFDCPKLHGEGSLAPVRITNQPKNEISVKDGDVIEIGSLKIQVIHTPGHSKGSCCFLAEDALFTGDTLFCGSCGRTDFYDSDMTEMHESLLRLGRLKGDYRVFPGHEEATTLQYEREHNPYMR